MSGGVGFSSFFEEFFEFSMISYRYPMHKGKTWVDLPVESAVCRVAIVEFDDQGLCYNEHAMDDIQQELDGLDSDIPPVIIVFAHGWKHNASSNDNNLKNFQNLLKDISVKVAPSKRPVLGIYLAWRGLSRAGNFVWEQLSFWDRKQAAARVASGSARELLGRLKAFRNGPPRAGGPPRATLIVVGHSFGGLVVYTALAQSLIEAAATRQDVVPSFGDLVLLVNPAFSAVSYLPIHRLIQRSHYNPAQFPFFVAVTATNDYATGVAYPAGLLPSLFTEAWRDSEEREAIFRTMGHLKWLRTHTLSASDPAASSSGHGGRKAFQSLSGADSTKDGLQTVFGGVSVSRLYNRKASPFWVASATPDIIDGHNGIFKPAFIDFVQALVAATLADEVIES
jgi:pimeloyl-ACP methyl ester carboxylesterase